MTDVVLTRRPFPQAIRMALGLPETADDTEVVIAAAMAYQLAALAETRARADAAPEPAPEPEPELTHIADLGNPQARAALARLTTGPRPGHACTPPADAPMGARWNCECAQPWKVARGAWQPA